jgi:hypothetical protein
LYERSIDEAGPLPQLPRQGDRVEVSFRPPRGLVASSVERAVVRSAQRHHEFVADATAERPRLREAQVMRVRRPATANNTRLQRTAQLDTGPQGSDQRRPPGWLRPLIDVGEG